MNCFQEDQATLCQLSCILKRIQASGSSWFWFLWPLAAWNFLSTFKGDKHLLWKPKHVCSDSALWHRQETLNCFCVNKATVMNSQTNSNWLNKNFYGLLLWLRGSELDFQLCLWPVGTKHNFSKTVSVPSAKTQLWRGIVHVTLRGEEFYTPQLPVKLRRPISI